MATQTLEEKVDLIVERNKKWDQDIEKGQEKNNRYNLYCAILVTATLMCIPVVFAFIYGYNLGHDAVINSITQKALMKFLGVDI